MLLLKIVGGLDATAQQTNLSEIVVELPPTFDLEWYGYSGQPSPAPDRG
jgi:hypothetical protein